MDPGTLTGIIVGIILAFLAGMGFSYGKSPVTYESGPRVYGVLEYFSIINWFRVLYYFLPYALFLFGIIYDGLIQKIKFFPAGFIGLVGVYVNSFISARFGFGTVDQDICGIPGMSTWGSDIVPQNIAFVSTVLSYMASYITTKQGDAELMSTGVSWITVFGVWIIQAVFFNTTGCNETKVWALTGNNDIAKRIVPPLLGLASGLLYGGVSGWAIANYVDVGGGSIQQSTLVGGGKSGPAMVPTSGTAGAGKCSSTGGDDDQFVCEAYKNGELVTTTIAE